MEIRFHIKTAENGYLSNFAPYAIELDGHHWPTVEHYYQAKKFPHDPTWAPSVLTCRRPYDIWRLARQLAPLLRADWDEVKEDVMRIALRAKFTQHEELRKRLLATGEALLIEDAPNDPYWGCGADGQGKNRLGCLLMETRTFLRTAAWEGEPPVQDSVALLEIRPMNEPDFGPSL